MAVACQLTMLVGQEKDLFGAAPAIEFSTPSIVCEIACRAEKF
jgi:hypothetical protein